MSAASDLIATLDEIGDQDLPWSHSFKIYANALRRSSRSGRKYEYNREAILHRLEGVEDMAVMASLMERDLLIRLGDQIIEAWSLHNLGKWPEETAE